MLRKTLILIAALALVASAASAQLLPRFGVKGGLNFSTVDLDDLDASTRTGYAAGLFVNLSAPGMNLQGEVLYSVKGFSEGTWTSAEEFDYRDHVIEIPVLLKFALPLPAVSPALYAGPAVSFPIKSEFKLDDDWVEIDEDGESMAWSVVIGADVTLMDHLVIDVRYDWGISSLRKTDFGALDDNLDEEIKDRTFSLMAGYKF